MDVFADVKSATRALSRKDKGLKRAAAEIGAPTIRRRDGNFAGLFRIIIEQQVSVPSAQAIWKRCNDGVDCTSPEAVARLGVNGLRALGLSTPKARYVVGIAEAAAAGRVDFAGLSQLDDEEAVMALVALKGIGPWTASIYLLFCEGRVDIWPPNDVALRHAYCAAVNESIDQRNLDARARGWTPYRGVAAHILWTFYARLRGRTPQ
ncbi:MAG: hypothetical protein U5J99_11185 [Parvularculaceae bacterium]|nr:hypothetical protein [Parvularculaceae bacterium]